MPDNEFEKKMSQQMEDFTYSPSDAVWQKLETELRTKKKKRRGFIWFFSGVLILSMGLYFYSRDVQNMVGMTQDKFSHWTPPGISKIKEPLPVTKGQVEQKGITTDNAYTKVEGVKNDSPLLKITPKQERFHTGDKILQTRKREALAKPNEEVPSQWVMDKRETSPSEKFANSLLVYEFAIAHQSERNMTINAPASIDPYRHVDTLNLIVNNNASVLNGLPTPEKKSDSEKNKMTFGIRVEAGRSGNSDNTLGQTKAADLVYIPSSGPAPVYYPYSQDPLFAWSLGAWIKKPVSQKMHIQAGLIYHQYRTGITVGLPGQGPLNSNPGTGNRTADQYYLPGNSDTYINQYHILSLPLEIHFQLNKGKKLPISWQIGAVPGWMLASNALVKKDTSGILYSDKSLFNHFQMGFQTGILFRVFNKGIHPVELGPVFQYMVTPAFKKEAGFDGHLSFIGIRADWTLFSSGQKQR